MISILHEAASNLRVLIDADRKALILDMIRQLRLFGVEQGCVSMGVLALQISRGGGHPLRRQSADTGKDRKEQKRRSRLWYHRQQKQSLHTQSDCPDLIPSFLGRYHFQVRSYWLLRSLVANEKALGGIRFHLGRLPLNSSLAALTNILSCGFFLRLMYIQPEVSIFEVESNKCMLSMRSEDDLVEDPTDDLDSEELIYLVESMGLCEISLRMSGLESCAEDNAVSPQLSEKETFEKLFAACEACELTGSLCAEAHQASQEHLFINGDVYVGSRQGDIPEGTGKYLWPDGCMYEGEWKNGKKSGKGKISWPSGATYEGDFLAGFIHGFGTYTGVDGSTYTGNWFLNEKRGFGTKSYINGDFYEGSWNKGLPDGEGRYVWKNGDVSVGEWRSGAKSGRGVLLWACGDKYEGQWMDGLEHGHGVYSWKDGSTYAGTWSRGVKDGKGTFIPARSSSSLLRQDSSEDKSCDFRMLPSTSGTVSYEKDQRDSRGFMLYSDGLCHGKLTISESSTSSDSGLEDCPSFERSWSLDESFDRFVILDDEAYVVKRQDSVSEKSTLTEQDAPTSSIFERHYVQGVLVTEVVKGDSSKLASRPLTTQRSTRARESIRAGETISRGHQSYELMLSLQLGIRYTIGKKSSEQAYGVSLADFGPKARVWMSFPKQGSQLTPPHHSTDFKWKDYCPAVFRHLRELFKIDTAEYMMSICGDTGLRELSSPGKSGSVFYISHDDRFLIKTVRKAEGKVLLGMLWNYYNHVRLNENTLIAKFYGLHRIKPMGGPKVRFVVMANMFCTDLWIHRRFDLKGSSQGRSAHKLEMDETTTLKDLDLNFVFRLQPSWREALLRQVERDCKFLERERIMDYSLLLGLHFCMPQLPSPTLSQTSEDVPTQISTSEEARTVSGDVTAADAMLIVSPESNKNGFSPISQDNVHPLGEGQTTRLQMQLGVNVPAKAHRKMSCNGSSHSSLDKQVEDGHDVFLYFGIIDILQQYDMNKKLERAYKSVQYDPLSISAVDPNLYSRRFQSLIQKTFQESAEI
ncbi:hypothetical protein GOP47_0024582 [Adiantum capillus-veneris]|uniref:1-phosphatidylinositol-4-phosphate 5-kinase n=1 Tax=Adiantum capillus-veneris TaxID=13818 RepID=A0A9D4U2X5_ADICA|nr:hypothetical protein GOP47_0024582 [Adiantum capillus-veneris]